MSSLKLLLAQRLFDLGERAIRNAARSDLDRAIARLNASVARLERSRNQSNR